MFGTNADIIIFGKIGHFQRIIPPSSTQLGKEKNGNKTQTKSCKNLEILFHFSK